jgi:hypothetical protein
LPAGRVLIRAQSSPRHFEASRAFLAPPHDESNHARAVVEVDLRAGERHDLDLELADGKPIAGVVRAADGAPLARLAVTLRGRCDDPIDPSVFARRPPMSRADSRSTTFRMAATSSPSASSAATSRR